MLIENLRGAYRSLRSAPGFTATAIPTLQVVLLQNEIVSLANLCFTGANSTSSMAKGSFYVSYFIDQSAFKILDRLTGRDITRLNCLDAALESQVHATQRAWR